jgi:hypothetical protein
VIIHFVLATSYTTYGTGACHVSNHKVYRYSPRLPSHGLSVLATSSTPTDADIDTGANIASQALAVTGTDGYKIVAVPRPGEANGPGIDQDGVRIQPLAGRQTWQQLKDLLGY